MDRARNCAFLDLESKDLNQSAAWIFAPQLLNCPKSVIDAESILYLRWWNDWRRLRLLPFDGDLSDQPAYVVDLIQIAEQTFAEMDARRSEEAADSIRKALERGGKNGS